MGGRGAEEAGTPDEAWGAMNMMQGETMGRWGRSSLGVILAAVALLALGLLLGRSSVSSVKNRGRDSMTAPRKAAVWTCSMHPQIRQPEPGSCPLCGMDLIPLKGDSGASSGPREMRMSPEAVKLASIRTTVLERRYVERIIPMVGKVDFNEQRVKTLSAWVGGRLERLYVDYTGVPVAKGDHLVEIYSPELYTAQEELIQALKSVEDTAGAGEGFLRRTATRTLAAAREKLKLLGLGATQIQEVEGRGRPSATVTIRAPFGGIVVHKALSEGAYVKTGTPIYKVADLSVLWVQLDAYESDLAWIRYGQTVELQTEAHGDRTFEGWVSFIDPVLDPRTRTVKLRVVVDNRKGLLRPNMFVRARLKVRLGQEGQVLSDRGIGKWICPMHPEEAYDRALPCKVCGMATRKAVDLGYGPEEDLGPALVVPASAVLSTGRRAVVYRRLPGAEPSFEGVEVELGPRAGDVFLVRSGLREGDEVVTHGQFKIDSALQIQAKPSMMSASDEIPSNEPGPPRRPSSPGGDMPSTMTMPGMNMPPKPVEGKGARILSAYLAIHGALASDDGKTATREATRLVSALEGGGAAALKSPATGLAGAESLQKQREYFSGLSAALEGAIRSGALPLHEELRRFNCPMAFDNRGADWLQRDSAVRNPYFGKVMLECGSETGRLAPFSGKAGAPHGN